MGRALPQSIETSMRGVCSPESHRRKMFWRGQRLVAGPNACLFGLAATVATVTRSVTVDGFARIDGMPELVPPLTNTHCQSAHTFNTASMPVLRHNRVYAHTLITQTRCRMAKTCLVASGGASRPTYASGV